MAEAQESFLEQTKVRVPSTSFNADDFWNINGVKKLSGYQRAVAKALYSYRDQQAKKQDRPPFKIFQDRTLLEIAGAVPQSKQELSAVHGMSDGQVRRYGRSILRIIERAKKDPVPKPPEKKNNRPPEEVRNRYEQLRNWRKITAQDRGVESDVILSRSVMWSIARANPKSTSELSQVDALGDWRLQVYGQDIIEAINDSR